MIPELHPQAEAEAGEAAAWYDDQQSGLGDQFADDLARALETVAADPGRYPFVPGVPESLNVRRRSLSRFPYSVVYIERGVRPLVIAVAHAKRRPLYWRRRLE